MIQFVTINDWIFVPASKHFIISGPSNRNKCILENEIYQKDLKVFIHPRCRVPFPVSPSNCSPFRLGPGEATANRCECHGKNQKLGNRSGIFRIKPRKLLDKECQLVRMDPRLLFSWEMLADTRPDTKEAMKLQSFWPTKVAWGFPGVMMMAGITFGCFEFEFIQEFYWTFLLWFRQTFVKLLRMLQHLWTLGTKNWLTLAAVGISFEMDSNISTTWAWFSQRNRLLQCHDFQETALSLYIYIHCMIGVFAPLQYLYRCMLNGFNIGNHPFTNLIVNRWQYELEVSSSSFEYQSLLTSLICHSWKGTLEGGK